MTDDLPPLKFCVNLLIGVLLFLLVLLLVYTPSAVPKLPQQPTISVKIETIPNDQMIILGGNSVVGLTSPISENEVLASLTAFRDIPVIKRIIFCESTNNPNAKNPNSSAKGLMQIINKTAGECREYFGREMNMYNSSDNLACGEYLYNRYGLKPWASSRGCWDK